MKLIEFKRFKNGSVTKEKKRTKFMKITSRKKLFSRKTKKKRDKTKARNPKKRYKRQSMSKWKSYPQLQIPLKPKGNLLSKHRKTREQSVHDANMSKMKR